MSSGQDLFFGFEREAAAADDRPIYRCAGESSAATTSRTHVVVDVAIDVSQTKLFFVQTCVDSGGPPRLEVFVGGEGVNPAPYVIQLRKEFPDSLVASDRGAPGCQDQHGDGLEAFYHTRVSKLTPPVEVDFVGPHGVAHIKVHQMHHHLTVCRGEVELEQVSTVVVGNGFGVLGIFVGEGGCAGTGTAGLHDGSCSANGDVGAEGDCRELGYGVVGDIFVGGAAGFGRAVVFHSLDNTTLWVDDKGPSARRLHRVVDPAGLLFCLHLLVDFLMVQESTSPVC